MAAMDYERIGRLIYGACRYGAHSTDILNWMADDLGLVRVDAGDDQAVGALYAAFTASDVPDDAFQSSCERFFDTLKTRRQT